jgi:hypothetical protein
MLLRAGAHSALFLTVIFVASVILQPTPITTPQLTPNPGLVAAHITQLHRDINIDIKGSSKDQTAPTWHRHPAEMHEFRRGEA